LEFQLNSGFFFFGVELKTFNLN